MASTSGRIETGLIAGNSKFYLQWQLAGQDSNGCYSTINWQAGLWITNSGRWYSNAVKINNIYINDVLVLGSTTWSNIFGNGDHELASSSMTIGHDGSSGYKDFGASISGWLYANGNYSASGAWNLPTIPRYANFTQHYINNIYLNSVQVVWATDVARDWTQYSLNGGGWTDAGDAVNPGGASGYYTVGGLAHTTNYNIRTRVRRADSGLWTETGYLYFTTVNGYTTFNSHSSPAKTLNSIDVSWSAANACDAVQYTINNGSSWNSVTYGSTYKITGLSPNTTYSIKTRVKRTDTQSWSESSALAVTTYDYAKIVSANNCTDEEMPRMNFTFDQQTGITVNARLELVSPTATIINQTGVLYGSTSYDFLLNSTMKNQIYTKCGSALGVTIRYVVATVVGGTETYWSTVDKTMTIINDDPIFTNFTYADTNAKTIALTGNNQIAIGKYSSIQMTVSAANKMTGTKGATPSKYAMKVGSITSPDVAYSSSVSVSATIENANSSTLTVVAKDDRGNQTPAYKAITNLVYSEVIASSIEINRKDGIGLSAIITGKGAYDTINFGASANTITAIDFSRKVKGTPTWGPWIDIKTLFTIGSGSALAVDEEIPTIIWDLGVEYDVQVRFKDTLSEAIFPTTLSSGNTLWDAVKDEGVAFGGLYDSTKGGALQIEGDKVVGEKVIYNPSGGGILIELFPSSTLTKMVTIEVKGNGYGTFGPINTLIQCYHYTPSGTFLNYKQANFGAAIGTAKFMIYNAKIYCWIPFTTDSYPTLVIKAWNQNYPLDIVITNSAEPAGTNKVTCTLVPAGGTIVEDVLTSTSTTNALSAAQGKALNDTKLALAGGTITGEIVSNGGYISRYRGAATDCNTCLTEGCYTYNTSTTNRAGNYGKLIVVVSDSKTHDNSTNWIWQTAYDTSGVVYRRQKINSGAWSAWVNQALDAYPVGAIYISAVNTSPATLFGGTWTPLYDRFLIGAGNSYGVNTTGGSTYQDYTHNHPVGANLTNTNPVGGSGVIANNTNYTGTSEGGSITLTTKSIMPPYNAKYMWQRTA